VAEVIETSVGSFEVGWGLGSDGSYWLEVDPDGGMADNPWIEEMSSAEDIALFFVGSN
jgi:hypothetical protein